jgi:transposase
VALSEESGSLLREENRILKSLIAALEDKVADLARRLSLNSSNSSKPPSSDGPSKSNARPPISSRETTKPKGGQVGHKGETMEQVANPDIVIDHPVHECGKCGADLSCVPVEMVVKRQVKDVEIKTVVSEHRGEVKTCRCGARTCGPFPPEVKAPMQAGNGIKAIALCLSGQFIAKDRLSETLKFMFGIELSDTTLLKYEAQLAQNLKGFYEAAHEHLKQAPVKHADETGMRVGGKTCWMHVLSTDRVTHLRHSASRKCLLPKLAGTLVHDHYSSYKRLENVVHSYCNAHHLRELKALIQYDKEEWAIHMHTLLRCACHLKNEGLLTDGRVNKLSALYDVILAQALSHHETLVALDPRGRTGKKKRSKGHNLALRLQREKDGVLLFMREAHVPFTNNQAERDLRMVKVKQKVSGCFRTVDGAENFAIIRSFISTLMKNARNPLEALRVAISKPVMFREVVPPNTPALLPAHS